MKFYVSVLCPTRNKGCHSRLCGFFCIKWKSIQSYHYSCIEESSLFSKNWWCDKYLWIGLFHLIFWCKLLLLSKATFSFNLGKKTVPKYEGSHYFVSLGKRGAGKASSAQGHWMRAELAGVGAEVLYFFQSDLNICVCYLQPSLQPPGQSVLPDFFFLFIFSEGKIRVEFGRQKSQTMPRDHRSSLVEYKTLWCSCKYLCSLISHSGWVLFFVFFQSAALNSCLWKCHGAAAFLLLLGS